MNTKKALATAALGLGLGAMFAPTAAMASVSAPGSVAAGGVARITSSCPASGTSNYGISGPSGYARNFLQAGALSWTAPNTPGVYTVQVNCADLSSAGSARITVTPRGGPAGGDGGKVDNTLTLTAGTALLGAAVGGFILMRRRAQANN